MNKAKQFDDVLNECIERILKGDAVADCLAAHPEYAAALEPLLRTALETKNAAAILPRPEFRQRAGLEFQAAICKLTPKKCRAFGWQVRWVSVIAAFMAILMLGSGTVLASDNSLPDGILYPVKLARENLHLTLTRSPLGKAEVYAQMANERVSEIVIMADKGKVAEVEKATQRMDGYLVAMANLPLPENQASAAEGAPPALMATQSDNAAPAATTAPPLKSFATDTNAPPPTVTAPSAAATGAFRATPAPSPEYKNNGAGNETSGREKGRVELKNTVSYQAEQNRHELEEVLKRAPDSVKPALRRALDVVGNGYQEALSNIEKGDP
jgi:hypothetical protein